MILNYDQTLARVSKQNSLENELKAISSQPEPNFATYKPNFEAIHALASKYQDKSHIIIIGRGGSITSTEALYRNLSWFDAKKQVFFCNSADPDFITYIKSQCPPDKSLVITVSKSGTNVEHLENTFAFSADYQIIAITGTDENNPLRVAAKKYQWDLLDHPNVGGRFSGMTESTLGPCGIIGMDIEKIYNSCQNAYRQFAPNKTIEDGNIALECASTLFQLEKQGFDEIFMSFYSVQAFGFAELASQLFHETVCKDEKQGQTLVALLSPESQHHFSQRFYGGKHNMIGFMITVNNAQDNHLQTQLPLEIQQISINEGQLKSINGITLSQAIHAEYEGNREDAEKRGIPLVTISLQDTKEEATAWFMAFLQYTSIYSAWLRGVDPYSQPHVESSKLLSFRKRQELTRA